ncbi:MAG: hypothetical protein JWO81_3398, partial [Alphaproteobacteria bacterium]|nr:hypothetical protein [Alphaproteobacteria bacterium]
MSGGPARVRDQPAGEGHHQAEGEIGADHRRGLPDQQGIEEDPEPKLIEAEIVADSLSDTED